MTVEFTNLQDMTKEELITECERREKVAHDIWLAVTAAYGPVGFLKVVTELESKKQRQQGMRIS
jgi:hypothetical protein